ncbi:MAG: rhomboid family intramembrane serine protease [Planctomycetaceae bacterium]
MGFDSRDYARTEGPQFDWDRRGGWSAVKWIIVITAVTYVVQFLGYSRGDQVTRLLEIDFPKVLSGQVWRLLTTAFAHHPMSVWHIFFNMVVLWMVGPTIESLRGSREFLAFYLSAAIISSLAYLGWGLFIDRLSPAIGASGAVSAAAIYFAMKYPNHVWQVYGIIPVRAYVLAIIKVGMDLLPMLIQLTGGVSYDNIGHSAHLGGALFGYLYYRYDWSVAWLWPMGWGKQWQKWKSGYRRRTSKLRVYHPEATKGDPRTSDDIDDRSLTAQADRILQKLGEQGEQSLTDQERELLAEESRRARARQSRLGRPG